MRLLLTAAVAIVVAGCASHSTPIFQTRAGDDLFAKRGESWRWSFDEPGSGSFAGTLAFESPRRMFFEVLGRWSPAADADAPSAPNVFRQSESLKDGDAPRVVVGSLVFADFVASVSCRPRSGVARTCGLIVRAQSVDDYDVARWDEARRAIDLVHVVDGREELLASADGPVIDGVPRTEWHRIEVDAHLRAISVTLDATVRIDARDDAFHEGKIGLWTRADSVSDFDDLEVVAE